jgi:hypothetical protein
LEPDSDLLLNTLGVPQNRVGTCEAVQSRISTPWLRDADYLTLSTNWTPAWGCAVLGVYLLVFAAAAIAALRIRD